ncbi:MAG TPA: vitamin K epoxide reductase family protein [Terriglobales bacterium]|nr:vitamin K epoxide reductase family protein [Terriglobales bacterium]
MNTRTAVSREERGLGRSRLMNSIALAALAGVVVSSFSLSHHFGTAKTSFCNFGESFNCDLVNRSQYSTVLGVPVALIGLCGYILILLLATAYRNKAETRIFLTICCTAGLAFSLYLTYIEKFVISAWCILCLSSLGIISILTVLSAIVAFRRSPQA